MSETFSSGSAGEQRDPPPLSSPQGEKPEEKIEAEVALEYQRMKKAEAMLLRGSERKRFQRRRISDRVFDSVEFARSELQQLLKEEHEKYQWLLMDIPWSVDVVEDEKATPVSISPVAAVGLATAAHMALDWKTIPQDQETQALTSMLRRFLTEMHSSQSPPELVDKYPHWGGILHVLGADAMRGGEYMRLLRDGIDEDVLKNGLDFTVNAKTDTSEQIEAIAAGIVDRLRELYSEERKETEEEMAGWELWEHDVRLAKLEDILVLADIYRDVQIPPKLLLSLISHIPTVRRSAVEMVRNQGGFLHAPDSMQLSEMIQHGVAAMIDDHAYYGVLTDPACIQQHLKELCGYDPQKGYASAEDLLPQSDVGLLQWVHKRSALDVFRNIENVALTVELAVKKLPGKRSGKLRRHSGMAAALKHYVYSRVPQPLILTRHFEILEVDGQPVAPVENYGSMRGIQTLGGHCIGNVEEEFEIAGIGEGKPIKLRVLWHFSLIERRVALEEIERRRRWERQ